MHLIFVFTSQMTFASLKPFLINNNASVNWCIIIFSISCTPILCAPDCFQANVVQVYQRCHLTQPPFEWGNFNPLFSINEALSGKLLLFYNYGSHHLQVFTPRPTTFHRPCGKFHSPQGCLLCSMCCTYQHRLTASDTHWGQHKRVVSLVNYIGTLLRRGGLCPEVYGLLTKPSVLCHISEQQHNTWLKQGLTAFLIQNIQ